MKFQVNTVAALALISGSSAFCPAVRPMAPRGVATDLSMSSNDNDNVDIGKAAMSFMAASMIAASSATTLFPIEPAFAAAAAAPTTTVVNKKVADTKKVTDTKKVDVKKLAPEEKNKIDAKKGLDLAEQTLKEYTKIAADAKSADSKASTAFKSQEKVVAGAKKTLVATSDKLSAAKNQKMPQTAIKELSEKAGE
jgi:hypothetical protein